MFQPTRAEIVDTDWENAKVQVRIPRIDGAGKISDGELSWASIIYTPGINVQYQVGDIVEVLFEDNEYENPIVLGCLLLKDKKLDSKVYIDAIELKVEDKFEAPVNSIIGKTTYEEIFDDINDIDKD